MQPEKILIIPSFRQKAEEYLLYTIHKSTSKWSCPLFHTMTMSCSAVPRNSLLVSMLINLFYSFTSPADDGPKSNTLWTIENLECMTSTLFLDLFSSSLTLFMRKWKWKVALVIQMVGICITLIKVRASMSLSHYFYTISFNSVSLRRLFFTFVI